MRIEGCERGEIVFLGALKSKEGMDVVKSGAEGVALAVVVG